ncbi:hypothetical protein KP79_PYT01946 [Mizuhopecten yessoensis]|uniref:Uncharacterized protein n=1 Tax=Mizuhopecten yessoensis TaxID=6573 RepID=A0A210Q2U5_MIZYE|nr:hypothetical protein KP79_PYT01946 [Mizuhopecten yessoensis]
MNVPKQLSCQLDNETNTFELELPDHQDMSDEEVERFISTSIIKMKSTQDIEVELAASADPGIPSPWQPVRSDSPHQIPANRLAPFRFKKVTEEERKSFEDAKQSLATRRNTQWGLS